MKGVISRAMSHALQVLDSPCFHLKPSVCVGIDKGIITFHGILADRIVVGSPQHPIYPRWTLHIPHSCEFKYTSNVNTCCGLCAKSVLGIFRKERCHFWLHLLYRKCCFLFCAHHGIQSPQLKNLCLHLCMSLITPLVKGNKDVEFIVTFPYLYLNYSICCLQMLCCTFAIFHKCALCYLIGENVKL